MPGCSTWRNTTDPQRAKFYSDVRERVTASSVHLLFFTLELNRIDDSLIERALGQGKFGRYRPWIEDVRKEKPYQLEDRVEQLFHEKSVTGGRRLEPSLRRDDLVAPLSTWMAKSFRSS